MLRGKLIVKFSGSDLSPKLAASMVLSCIYARDFQEIKSDAGKI